MMPPYSRSTSAESAARSSIRYIFLATTLAFVCHTAATRTHAHSGLGASKAGLISSGFSNSTSSTVWPNPPSAHGISIIREVPAVPASRDGSSNTKVSTQRTVISSSGRTITTSTTTRQQQWQGNLDQGRSQSLQQQDHGAPTAYMDDVSSENNGPALQQTTAGKLSKTIAFLRSPTIRNSHSRPSPPPGDLTTAQLQTGAPPLSPLPPQSKTSASTTLPISPVGVVSRSRVNSPSPLSHAPVVVISSPNHPVAPWISSVPVQFIEISFGGPTVENNPLMLYSITGVQRCLLPYLFLDLTALVPIRVISGNHRSKYMPHSSIIYITSYRPYESPV